MDYQLQLENKSSVFYFFFSLFICFGGGEDGTAYMQKLVDSLQKSVLSTMWVPGIKSGCLGLAPSAYSW